LNAEHVEEIERRDGGRGYLLPWAHVCQMSLHPGILKKKYNQNDKLHFRMDNKPKCIFNSK
jgi:hypothetical protein